MSEGLFDTEGAGVSTDISRSTSNGPILSVKNLEVKFKQDDRVVHAVRGVNFDVHKGRVLGIVGESGSGKSASLLAIMGLLGGNASVEGSIQFAGDVDLLGLPEKGLNTYRNNRIGMVFQDPMSCLNPVYKIGYQITEALRCHDNSMRGREGFRRAEELLELVGLPDPRTAMGLYPHELSGGMRQRVVIAIAICNGPDVILADEPTTALDVTIQAQVLQSLRDARAEVGAALVLVTHDLAVVSAESDDVAVMYGGRIVESGLVRSVFSSPRMPYTLGLLGSIPGFDGLRSRRLASIEGAPPELWNPPRGCSFAPRCPMAKEVCWRSEPELSEVGGQHFAACHYSSDLEGVVAEDLFEALPAEVGELVRYRGRGRDEQDRITSGAKPSIDLREDVVVTGWSSSQSKPEQKRNTGDRVVLSVRDLVKHFPLRGSVFQRAKQAVHAVCGVSFELREGETVGLVGESGCGKSTTARLLTRLITATSGEIELHGESMIDAKHRRLREMRRAIGMVFQDPLESLDPRMNVGELIAEPLRIHKRFGRSDQIDYVLSLMRAVGLSNEYYKRFPHEFSGGQRQRIGIARSLALQPSVLVLDEPVSALDVSIQAGVVNLLQELQETLGLAYVFIAHDLSVVRHIADRVAVMYMGRIVEIGPAEQVFESPIHPYTRSLVAAVPRAIYGGDSPTTSEDRLLLGDVPSAANPPSGCRFRTRCPKFANDLSDTQRALCISENPELAVRVPGRQRTACHFVA